MKSLTAVLLSAGVGSRLSPLTNDWPKCLMPVQGVPILEYWLDSLASINVKRCIVNTCHQHSHVEKFLHRPKYKSHVKIFNEKSLLGTAGTLRALRDWLGSGPVLMVHADNWCGADLNHFVNFHTNERPHDTHMSMMTFLTNEPQSCGIVKVDREGVLTEFNEKSKNPQGNLANGAVYILEGRVLDFIYSNEHVQDFSCDVLPAFVGSIATWHNHGFHIDIGTSAGLAAAQKTDNPWTDHFKGLADTWSDDYKQIANDLLQKLNSPKGKLNE